MNQRLINRGDEFRFPFTAEDRPVTRPGGPRWFVPTSIHTVFITLLILLTLSLCVIDAKGVPLLLIVLMYAGRMRVALTHRAEQRRTNELLNELLDEDREL
ncbi:hypothetical protein [Deinococcus taklimakanensis]|uniref:hypothetical protein n=1 Tax=Deinococcus taklimakanensis TaxID=536443 RepID=UPI0036DAD2A0